MFEMDSTVVGKLLRRVSRGWGENRYTFIWSSMSSYIVSVRVVAYAYTIFKMEVLIGRTRPAFVRAFSSSCEDMTSGSGYVSCQGRVFISKGWSRKRRDRPCRDLALSVICLAILDVAISRQALVRLP